MKNKYKQIRLLDLLTYTLNVKTVEFYRCVVLDETTKHAAKRTRLLFPLAMGPNQYVKYDVPEDSSSSRWPVKSLTELLTAL